MNSSKRGPPGAVRIIAGEHRGRRLSVPPGRDLRPTPDRVRETLFNWLGQRLDGLVCLDLFAGTGALGFEAASRGAAHVVLVERDRATFEALVRAKALLREARVELVHADARQYLAGTPLRFDVVFLDPPFRQNALPGLLPLLGPRLLEGARLYVEAAAPLEPGRELPREFVELRRARAGEVSFQLLQWTGSGQA